MPPFWKTLLYKLHIVDSKRILDNPTCNSHYLIRVTDNYIPSAAYLHKSLLLKDSIQLVDYQGKSRQRIRVMSSKIPQLSSKVSV